MPKEPLFDLIEKLSASEKRYFKLYIQKQSGSNPKEYLNLFEVLEKLPRYEESKVLAAIKNPIFAKNLSSGKNYLYQLILKSLRAYHAESRALFKVYGLLQDIHILMEKNLMDQAAKRLQKAKKMAAKYFFNLPYLELLLLDRQLIRSYQLKQAEGSIDANHRESKDYMEQVIGHFDMLNFYDKSYLAIRNKMQLEDPEGTISELLKEYASKVAIDHFSFETRMLYHLIWTNYYLAIKGEIEHAQLHMKNILDLFEDNPHLIDEYNIRYINVVNNYLNIFYLKKDFSPFDYYIGTLRKIKPQTENLRIKLFETIYGLSLMQALGQQQYGRALQLVPSIIDGLDTYGKKMQKAFQLEFFQNIALVYLHSVQPKSALEWLLKVTQTERQDIRQDILLFCRTLQLIVHCELGHFQLAESLARSLLRSGDKRPEEVPYHQLVARALLKVIDSPLSGRRAIYRQLKEDLQGSPAVANEKEDVLYWLDRQLAD